MKKSLLILFLMTFFTVLPALVVSQDSIDPETKARILKKDTSDFNWLKGEWEGTGHQVGNIKWKMKIKVNSKNDIFVDYPGLNCNGTWILESNTDHAIRLKENIVKGLERCDQGCEVFLKKISDTEIKIFFYLETKLKGVYANAVLKKIN